MINVQSNIHYLYKILSQNKAVLFHIGRFQSRAARHITNFSIQRAAVVLSLLKTLSLIFVLKFHSKELIENTVDKLTFFNNSFVNGIAKNKCLP